MRMNHKKLRKNACNKIGICCTMFQFQSSIIKSKRIYIRKDEEKHASFITEKLKRKMRISFSVNFLRHGFKWGWNITRNLMNFLQNLPHNFNETNPAKNTWKSWKIYEEFPEIWKWKFMFRKVPQKIPQHQ